MHFYISSSIKIKLKHSLVNKFDAVIIRQIFKAVALLCFQKQIKNLSLFISKTFIS